MSEKTILVCDACGRPAAETVTIRVGRGNFVKDLCATHVSELISGARKPRPGRRRGVVSAASGPKKTSTRKTSTRKTSTRKTRATGKRRGRPRKTAS